MFTMHEIVAPVLLALVVLIVAYFIWRYERDQTNDFQLIDALMENGRVSKWALIIMGSWTVHTWALCSWVIRESATTGDFATYGAIWITPLIAKMFVAVPEKKEDP